MRTMKRQIKTIFAFLFILSIFTTSLHEMLPDHDESSCEICILVQHDSGLLPVSFTALPKIDSYYQTITYTLVETPVLLLLSNNPRAPPSFS
jgi:hypothetical protein